MWLIFRVCFSCYLKVVLNRLFRNKNLSLLVWRFIISCLILFLSFTDNSRGNLWACCCPQCEDWGSRCLWEGFLPVEALLYRCWVSCLSFRAVLKIFLYSSEIMSCYLGVAYSCMYNFLSRLSFLLVIVDVISSPFSLGV